MTDTCSICLDNLEKGSIYGTPCGHIFHADCLQVWKSKNSTCPICRECIGTCQKESLVSPFLDALLALHFFSNI